MQRVIAVKLNDCNNFRHLDPSVRLANLVQIR
jgi:hypothetical protein